MRVLDVYEEAVLDAITTSKNRSNKSINNTTITDTKDEYIKWKKDTKSNNYGYDSKEH